MIDTICVKNYSYDGKKLLFETTFRIVKGTKYAYHYCTRINDRDYDLIEVWIKENVLTLIYRGQK
jgi:hypothetical protein